jgi:hypothetical protein
MWVLASLVAQVKQKSRRARYRDKIVRSVGMKTLPED